MSDVHDKLSTYYVGPTIFIESLSYTGVFLVPPYTAHTSTNACDCYRIVHCSPAVVVEWTLQCD